MRKSHALSYGVYTIILKKPLINKTQTDMVMMALNTGGIFFLLLVYSVLVLYTRCQDPFIV